MTFPMMFFQTRNIFLYFIEIFQNKRELVIDKSKLLQENTNIRESFSNSEKL